MMGWGGCEVGVRVGWIWGGCEGEMVVGWM